MSIAKWRTLSRSELVELAHENGIPNLGRLSKDALIDALHRQSRAKPKAKARHSARPKASTKPHLTNGKSAPTKDLAAKSAKDQPRGTRKDRIVCMVRDPYWLHVYWELTRQSVERAEAALGQNWHGAKPVLRLIDVTPCELHSSSETILRDIEIHGGSNSWYIDVVHPPCSYRVDIGYLAKNGQFFTLGRSNIATTPIPSLTDDVDDNWADLDYAEASKIFAMSGGFDPGASSLELKKLFEERLHRPIGTAAETTLGPGASTIGKLRQFRFDLEAEMIVHGRTDPQATVTLRGQSIKLRDDGTFTVRVKLAEGRQILSPLAVSADGIEERKIVLAVERNTRHLEPIVNEIEE